MLLPALLSPPLVAQARTASARGAELPARDTLHPYRPGIDVLHYDLSLTLPEGGNVIRGNAVLTVRRTAPVDTLVLDLLEPEVDRVDVGAGAAGAGVRFGRDSATVRIPLPRGSGDTLTIAVRYHGAVTDGLVAQRGERHWHQQHVLDRDAG